MTSDDDDDGPKPTISTSHLRLSEIARQIADAYQALGRLEGTGPRDAALCRRFARKARMLSRSFAAWATLSANIEAYKKKEMDDRMEQLVTKLNEVAARLGVDLSDVMK